MTIVVFVGPSLPAAEIQATVPIAPRPAARAGDVLRALADGASAIGLVDGLFGAVPSVRHAEILLALDQGVPVLGAASMGALRAAELDRHGMIGIGTVYRRYAAGELVTDDAVALVHGPAETGWTPLSEPLVDILATLEAARSQGVIAADEHAVIERLARATFYPDRRWPLLLDALPPAGRDRLAAWLPGGRRSVKTEDARALLRALPTAAPPARGPRVERTETLDALIRAALPGLDPGRFWRR